MIVLFTHLFTSYSPPLSRAHIFLHRKGILEILHFHTHGETDNMNLNTINQFAMFLYFNYVVSSLKCQSICTGHDQHSNTCSRLPLLPSNTRDLKCF